MKQPNELGLFQSKEKIKKRLPHVFHFGVLALFLVFGLQIAQAGNPSSESVIEALQTTISGTVRDADGSPLPGANVLVKGTTNGTQTDFDGNYTINAASDATLVFSYIGFATQEIPVNGQTVVDVTLSEDANKLEEVVIVGYTAQTRGDLTGSVASVDMVDANKQPVVNVAEALEGRVTGVTITNAGSPGDAPTVRVRGYGTTNNNNPLYIIDGAQTLDPSILNSINPNDIAQINVLKDGTAAIYGARASNGVIIVTTKSGGYNQNKLSVNLDIYTGFSRAANLPDMLTAPQLGDVFFESLTNDAIPTGDFSTVVHPQFFPNAGDTPSVPAQLRNVSFLGTGEVVEANVRQPNGTDWLDEIMRVAPTQNLSLTLSNGNERAKFSASFGYLNRQGIQLTTGFKRGQIRLNSEFKVNDRLTIGEHLNVSLSDTKNPAAGNRTQMAMRISPLVPVRDNVGRYAGTYALSAGLSNASNPVAELERGGDDFFRQTRILGDVYLNYEILDGLNFRSVIGGDINLNNERVFTALNPEDAEPNTVNSLRERTQQNYSWVWTNTLNYTKIFGKHSINALLGYEALQQTSNSSEVTAQDFLFETPDYYLISNASGSVIPSVNNTFRNESTVSSVFGSANYSYDSKYLLTATLRRDVSSRFSEDNRTGVFPAFSGGWVVSNEDFFPDDGFLNRLKLKASWGLLGNQELPVTNPQTNISEVNPEVGNYSFDGGSTAQTGAVLSAVGNPDLGWETSENFNLGTELDMFNNTLSFSLEYFRQTTDDLILQDRTSNSDTAPDAEAPWVNIGSIRNVGFDASISYQSIPKNDFSYGINLNVSTYENEVLELASEFLLDGRGFRGGSVARTQVGQPLAAFYGRVVDGIYRNEAEVAAGPDQGFANDAAGVGRLRYRDLNGDGIINDDDRDFIGNPHPDFTFGLNLTANYKNWDFTAFFTGSVGNDVYNYDRIFTDFPTFANGNRNARVLDAFHPDTNPNGSAPALSFTTPNGETNPTSFLLEDGTFVRLKNIVVGYTFPTQMVQKWGLSNFRLYLNASNLFTITDYGGIDPEIIPGQGSQDGLSLGADTNTFPLAQIFLFGANLKL